MLTVLCSFVTFWFGFLQSLDVNQRIQRDLVRPRDIEAPVHSGSACTLWVKYRGLKLSGAKVLMLFLYYNGNCVH